MVLQLLAVVLRPLEEYADIRADGVMHHWGDWRLRTSKVRRSQEATQPETERSILAVDVPVRGLRVQQSGPACEGAPATLALRYLLLLNAYSDGDYTTL